MASEEFNELLRRMPAVAKAVNAFESESIQKEAFEALMRAFEQEASGDGSPDASAEKPSAAKESSSSAGPSTADILAMARGQKPAATPTKKPAGEKSAAKQETAKPEKAEAKLSPVDEIKRDSNYLRGDVAAELADENPNFGKESVQIIKHFGTYQQDDRDARGKKSGGKSARQYMFMVRTRIPGGKLTSEQLLAELDLCDELGDTTLRVTSRQGLQLHGIVKDGLKSVIRRINDVQLSTLAACGDVERNVMCTPAPYKDAVHDQMQDLADRLAEHLAPRTRAYHEIFLQDPETGEKERVAGNGQAAEVEPIYGKQYLPRKFKTAIGTPGDNNIDIYTNDLGFLAIVEDGKIAGYNVLVGGGQGVTPSAEKTFPALAQPLAFITPDQAIDVATAVVKVQRDFGNREDRKVARMKYLIHNWGLPKFRAKVEEYYGGKLTDPRPVEVTDHDDHLGWREQGDGRWFYGLNVENGRIADNDAHQLKAALREICRELQPGIRLTAHQNILLTDVAESDKAKIEEILRRHGVRLTEETSTVRRWSMACVAFPTCGLAITESERALPGVMDELEQELKSLGLENERFTVRMTGCPNGCARPYNSDIGLVGRSKGKYTLFLGGRVEGDRLNFEYRDLVPREEIVAALSPVFRYFKQERSDGESLGDFCARKGKDDLLAYAEKAAVS